MHGTNLHTCVHTCGSRWIERPDLWNNRCRPVDARGPLRRRPETSTDERGRLTSCLHTRFRARPATTPFIHTVHTTDDDDETCHSPRSTHRRWGSHERSGSGRTRVSDLSRNVRLTLAAACRRTALSTPVQGTRAGTRRVLLDGSSRPLGRSAGREHGRGRRA